MAKRRSNRTRPKTGMRRELASARSRERVERASDTGGPGGIRRKSSSARSRTARSSGGVQKRSTKRSNRDR